MSGPVSRQRKGSKLSVSTLAAAIVLAGVAPDAAAIPPAASSTAAEAATPAEPPPAVPIPAVQPPPEPATDTIVVSGRTAPTPGDPMQGVNVQSFEVTQRVDEALVGPVALAYERSVPKPIRSGLRNALRNLNEPVVFLNFLLQLKPGKAIETLGRFTVNSTIGIAGLIDVAKKPPFRLPHRPNGFAYTMGYYGVKPGPYMFLPLIGPTTLRDLIGGGLDRLVLPQAIGEPFNRAYYSIPTGLVSSLDRRAELDEQFTRLRTESADPYAAFRDFYLQKRQAEIDALHGRMVSSPAPAPSVAPPTADPMPASPAAAPEAPVEPQQPSPSPPG